MNRTHQALVAGLFAALIFASSACSLDSHKDGPEGLEDLGSQSFTGGHSADGPDLDDPSVLASVSQNIFIGRVVEELGETDAGGFTETVYLVEVEENLLNELRGTVRVAKGGPAENFEDGSGELAPQETFLMATRYYPRLNWHTLATWEPVNQSSIEGVRSEIQSGVANPAPPLNPGAPELPVPAATAGAVDPAQPRALIPSEAEVAETPEAGVDATTTADSPTTRPR